MSADDPELRRMLALYREQRSPAPEQQQRVWEALDAQLAPEQPPEPTREPASGVGPATPRGWSALVRAAIAVLLIGSAVMLWRSTRAPASSASPPRAVQAPAAPVPASAPAAAPEPSAVPALPARDSEPVMQPPPESSPAERSVREPVVARTQSRAEEPGSTLAEELALLQRAQAALDANRPASALRTLRRHAARFTQGALAEEREAALVEALCELGRGAEARHTAARFVQHFPESPRKARVQAQCAAPEEHP